jgi:hypothetical protein
VIAAQIGSILFSSRMEPFLPGNESGHIGCYERCGVWYIMVLHQGLISQPLLPSAAKAGVR